MDDDEVEVGQFAVITTDGALHGRFLTADDARKFADWLNGTPEGLWSTYGMPKPAPAAVWVEADDGTLTEL